MLNEITLRCFRQHAERTFTFGPGLNAIRGENEAGKTTVLEAYLYFCFGTAALRESLEDVVTYDCPLSKLRVDVTMEHLGVTYTGYRGKSGAEVNFGNEKVVGQREVTRFFENLFGADAKTAGKLMFASQKALAESLKAGPTEAGRLIEDLANFDVLDQVIEAIQRRRPTGLTAAVESRVETLKAQLVEEPVEDLAPLRHQLDEANIKHSIAQTEFTSVKEKLDELDVDAARATLARRDALNHAAEIGHADLKVLDQALATELPVAPTNAEMDAARRAVEAEKSLGQARAMHATLTQTDTEMLWDEPLEALEKAILDNEAAQLPLQQRRVGITSSLAELGQKLASQVTEMRVQVTKLEGQLIKETTCSLCQKDLSDVPEVVRINSSINTQIEAAKASAESAAAVLRETITKLEKERDQVDMKLADLAGDLKELQAVVKANNRVEMIYAQAGDLITVDRSVVPGRWTWAGPDVTAAARPDVAGVLVALEQRARAATQAATRREEQQKQRDRLAERLEAEKAECAQLQVTEAEDTLVQLKQLSYDFQQAQSVLMQRQADVNKLAGDLSTKEALAAQRARALAQTREQLAAAEKELADMQRFNALLKKVRAARPEITNKLWNIVLGATSKYFTDVRGEPSKITRGDGIFRCNNRPVAGLSGSAEDMLGLAMRISLTRTFLPGVGMLLLDEPAAACSDSREARMLGMLSTLQFDQTLIVSHSDATDAFADRIINV